MDTKYFKLLKFLEPQGVAIKVNISAVLDEMFPLQDYDDISQRHEAYPHIQGFIQEMVKNEVISVSQYSIGNGSNGSYSWFHNTPIMAAITINGKRELDAEETREEMRILNASTLALNQSNKDTNEAVKKNIKSQENVQWINLIFTAVSTAFIVLTGVIAYKDKQEERLSEIASKVEKLTDEIAKQKPFQTNIIDTNRLNKTTHTNAKKH